MKKIILLPALMVAVGLLAQDPKFGLKAGLNLATVSNVGGNFKPGFYGGVLAHIHVTPEFSLQPEAVYSNQGTKFASGEKLLLNYVNVPLLLQYNFDNGFRLQAGPQVGFLLEAKQKLNDVEFDRSPLYKSVDFSVPLGFSYLGYSGFGIDGRYNAGVTRLYKNSRSDVSNGVVQLGLFYLFDHHHKARSSKRRH